MNQIKEGTIVRAEYKTGQYIGEVLKVSDPKSTVKVLSVMKHPTQGDLHHPLEVEGVFFHQRRALSFEEKALVPNDQIHLYQGEIFDYTESLQKSLELDIEVFEKTMRWMERSLEELYSLKNDYFK